MGCWDAIPRDGMIVRRDTGRSTCRFCGSADPIGWGWRYNGWGPKRRWRCRSCGRTFIEDDGFLGRRVDPEAICAAWDLYFRGVSLSGISRHLRTCWGLRATARAVLNWVRGYSKLLAEYVEAAVEERKVDGGTRWHEDIGVVKRRAALRYVFLLRGRGPSGRPVLLAAQYARDRGEDHAVALLKAARARTRDLPDRIVSDGEWSFERAYQRVFGLRHRGVRKGQEGSRMMLEHSLQHRPELLRELVQNPSAVLRRLGASERDLVCTDKAHEAYARGERFASEVKAMGELGPADALPKMATIARTVFGRDFVVEKEPFGIRFSERVRDLGLEWTATGTVRCTFGGLECGGDVDG